MLDKAGQNKSISAILKETWIFVGRELERLHKMPDQSQCLKNLWKKISLNLIPNTERENSNYSINPNIFDMFNLKLPGDILQSKTIHKRSRRGFATMDRIRQQEVASLGGRASHTLGRAHKFTSEEARQAGRKGGQAVSRDRQHMASIGRKGGQSCALKRKAQGIYGNNIIVAGDIDTSSREIQKHVAR